jgi:hypothetical protein
MGVNDGYVKWQWDPLGEWPRGKKRAGWRESAPFYDQKTKNRTNVGTTYNDLERAVRGMPNTSWGCLVRVRTALNPARSFARGTGMPKGDAPTPTDPSVIVEIEAKGGRLVYACDKFNRWQDNLRAVALTLEHLRASNRYGVLENGEQFIGSRALPPPGMSLLTPPMSVEAAARFIAKAIGHEHPEVIVASPDNYRSDYRTAAKKLHPDNNGGGPPTQDWHTLMAAKSVLDAHHQVQL